MLVARFGDKPVLLGGLALLLSGFAILGVTAEPLALAAAAIALGLGHAAWMSGGNRILRTFVLLTSSAGLSPRWRDCSAAVL